MRDFVLVVEDETALRESLVYNLENQGYRVEALGEGRAALETARRIRPSLIVLDIMLPGLDGFEFTRILRQESNTPVLMLTARDEEIDRVLGLEIGADDYLTKPFSMREFLARVKALIRRVRLDQEGKEHPGKQTDKILEFGNLAIDLLRYEAILAGKVLQIKRKEFDLLLFFCRHRGQVLTREMILERVWGWSFGGGTRTVDVHVRWLRSKIEPDPNEPTRIITVRGVGYRFDG